MSNIDEMKEKMALIVSEVKRGNISVFEGVDQLLNLKTDTCHISICKNEPEYPENPYPKEIFPMDVKEAGQFLRETIGDSKTTSVSGAIGRHVYNFCQQKMSDAGFEQRTDE